MQEGDQAAAEIEPDDLAESKQRWDEGYWIMRSGNGRLKRSHSR